MRKVLALVSALLVMLASLVPIPVSTAALAQASATVTVRDAETESLVRSLAHPLFRAASVDAGLVRITRSRRGP